MVKVSPGDHDEVLDLGSQPEDGYCYVVASLSLWFGRLCCFRLAWEGRLGDLLPLASKSAAGGFVEERHQTAGLVNASSVRPSSFSYFCSSTTYNYVVLLPEICFTLRGIRSTGNMVPLTMRSLA